jgi:hypothetical protein
MMDTSFLGYILAAFFGAVFGVGGNLIIEYFTSGKVTPDHLKKEDLNKLEAKVQKHIDHHEECEREYLRKETFDKHVHDCPVKELSKDLISHKLQHGKYDSEIFNRLDNMEKTMSKAADTSEKLTDGLHAVDLKLGLMVNKMDSFFKRYERQNP